MTTVKCWTQTSGILIAAALFTVTNAWPAGMQGLPMVKEVLNKAREGAKVDKTVVVGKDVFQKASITDELKGLEDTLQGFNQVLQNLKNPLPGIGVRLNRIANHTGIHAGWVSGVLKGGPAERAGMWRGDWITSINQQDVRSADNEVILRLIQESGNFVNIRVYRGGFFQPECTYNFSVKKEMIQIFPHGFHEEYVPQYQALSARMQGLRKLVSNSGMKNPSVGREVEELKVDLLKISETINRIYESKFPTNGGLLPQVKRC